MKKRIAISGVVFFALLLAINTVFEVSPPNNKSILIFIIVFVAIYVFQVRSAKTK